MRLAAANRPAGRCPAGTWRAGKRRSLAGPCLLTVLCVVTGGCAGTPVAAAHRRPAAGLSALAADYMAIARPANHRLEHEVDTYLTFAHRNLRAAEAQLRAEAATEQWFDARLLRIPFPAAIDATAHALVAINNLRIALTRRQAGATSIAGLLAFTGRHKAADAEVEAQVRIIRSELGLPPPATS